MTILYAVTTLEELEQYRHMVGKGTYNTAEQSIKQGKPTFIAVVGPNENV